MDDELRPWERMLLWGVAIVATGGMVGLWLVLLWLAAGAAMVMERIWPRPRRTPRRRREGVDFGSSPAQDGAKQVPRPAEMTER